MKKFFVSALVVMVAAMTLSGSAFAFEGSGDAYVGVYSKYLWRGLDLSMDDDYVVQGGSDVSFGAFTVSWWANANEDLDVNEVDLVLDYSFDASEMVSMSVGNILYVVPGADDTNELYLTASLNTILEPSFSIYYDYDSFAGDMYYTASVGHSIELSEMASVSAGALISYYDADGYSELHNGDISVGLDVALSDNLSLSASGLYTMPITDDAEDFLGHDGEGTVGVSIALAF
ncbi:MAG: hypothetical protein C0614_10830 [Desulfuromonas sp.]|nr:MAG: hypothetical protein C0614_10830 [Desulfuromonas sp.]